MQALKFRLSGKTAFFKKPDVNSYVYFTYGNIHKVALLGLLGSILGLDGYAFQADKMYPDFYSQLLSLKVSIVPKNEEGFIPKKIQVFNNSVGYASNELGGNLIVKEQWLEEPKWDIYILLNEKEHVKELKDRLMNNKYKYMPYLGKNDHFASIRDIEIIHLEKSKQVKKVNSLFIKRYFNILNSDLSNIANVVQQIQTPETYERRWKYEENLPISLEEDTNQYEFESFVFTNMEVQPKEAIKLYSYENKILFFF